MGYSRDIYDEALQKLEKQRMQSELEAQQRKNMMYQACPRLAEIEQEMASTASMAARAVFSGNNAKEVINKLRERNLALQKERKTILQSAQLPEDYLKPKYVCDKCKDEGYIDGKICDCMKRLLRKIAYDRLNRSSPLELSDFDTFSLDFYSDTIKESNSNLTHREFMQKVLNYCRQYARNFSEQSGSLLFQGEPGLGKTHLSLAIAKEVIEQGYGVVYMSVPILISKLESNRFGRHTEDSEDLNKALSTCDLLILDDLGTEFVTQYSTAEIFNIINTRMLTSLPTIISTNLTLTELQNTYNTRTVSRIIGNLKRFRFVGMDIRQQKLKAFRKP